MGAFTDFWYGVFKLFVAVVAAQFTLPVFLLLGLYDAVMSCTSHHKQGGQEMKCIVITGATQGIGEALALRYARKGVVLALIGRNGERLATVARACESRGAKVIKGTIDVTNRIAMQQFLTTVDAEHAVDGVFANAGVHESTIGAQRDIVRATETIFDVNVNGVFNTVLPVVEAMKARQRGTIVILSSVAGYGPLTRNVAYAASKSAVRVWGEGLRRVLHRYGVAVNVVCPGYVRSAMTAGNTVHMPFLMDMDSAVTRIVDGVAADTPVIAFPAAMDTLLYVVQSVYPTELRDLLARTRVHADIAYLRRKLFRSPEEQRAAGLKRATSS